MPNPFIADLHLHVAFGEPTPLPDFAQRIQPLLVQGVYALRDGHCKAGDFDPLGREVVYIGKAIGETIFTRCQKHFWTVTDRRAADGKSKTNPGVRFKAFRVGRQLSANGLYVFPAPMAAADPYLISCAEELLLFRYRQAHGDIPIANTKS